MVNCILVFVCVAQAIDVLVYDYSDKDDVPRSNRTRSKYTSKAPQMGFLRSQNEYVNLCFPVFKITLVSSIELRRPLMPSFLELRTFSITSRKC